MDRVQKVIRATISLINLPHNKFNLENYLTILKSYKLEFTFAQTKDNLPISLMSGNNGHAGIVETGLLEPKNKRNIYIIGKGILFDSGGMDLKTRGMVDMVSDKAGMIIALNVANYFGKNVLAFCPVTTNFIHTSKIIPGDEIKVGNKIIKVTNTDAEGRLILAEALTCLNPTEKDIVITIATLTGCCEYAVDKAVGVFGVNDKLVNDYLEASKESDEDAWRLPLWKHLEEKHYKQKTIKNSVKEIKAGATEGALFVKQFVKYPNQWLHLDIAPVAYIKDKATGVPVKSLINFIKKING